MQFRPIASYNNIHVHILSYVWYWEEVCQSKALNDFNIYSYTDTSSLDNVS